MKSQLPHAAGYALLIVVLSAGAAQSLAGTDTVFTDDIVAGGVTTPDIRDRAVTGTKVLDGSLTAADIAAGSVGLSRLGGKWTEAVRTTLYGDNVGYAIATCPSGQTAISGSAFSPSAAAAMMGSQPVGDAWIATFRNWISAQT